MRLLFCLLLFTFSMQLQAQTLEIQGDTAIVLVQGTVKTIIEERAIDSNVQEIKKQIEISDNKLLQIEALRAKELQEKSNKQTSLVQLLEIRNQYAILKKKLKLK